MEQIFNSCKSLIEPLLGRAAKTLGADESNVAKASQGILAGLLTKLAGKGSNPAVEHALGAGARANIVPHLATVFGTRGELEQEALGYKMFHSLYTDRTDDFTHSVANQYGLSKQNSYQLITMIATALAGFLGGKIADGRFSLASLADGLNKEKSSFAALVPALGATAKAAVSDNVRGSAPKKKGGMGWLWWLLALILLILLLLFGLRSCKKHKLALVDEARLKTEQLAEKAKADAAKAARTLRTPLELVLPNGVKINAFKGGMEDKMIAFLNSDTYKNAKTDDALRAHWFEFEDVDFVRGSADRFMDAAKTDIRLNNVAAILKAYPTANIRIGGNADKTGGEAYNMELSRERAIFIDRQLDKKGIDAHRISTEGFGDENAVWPASATAEESAKDRDIAFRFHLLK